MLEERRTLIECIYSGKLNGELFFDESKRLNYHAEFYGDPLNLGSCVLQATYENGKSKFIQFSLHKDDLEVLADITTQRVA